MQGHPTLDVLWNSLGEIDPSAQERWLDAHSRLRPVHVNGVDVPIVRIPWSRVDDFFQLAFQQANNALFGGDLPPCRLRWNSRFRGVAGRIECRSRRIELSSAHFEACGVVALGVVLIHEQIHLSLFEHRLPFGHTGEFKRRSREVGLPEIHHALPLPDRIVRRRRLHRWACRTCGRVSTSKIRFRAPRACADCCGRFARGRYDARFNLVYLGVEEPSIASGP
jgi:predicted SprT family Zn-dependent metalloprotease